MELLFDVYVEGQKVHTGVTQDMFFDIVEDLSQAYYKTGFPNPETISHTCYPKPTE